MTQPPDRSDPDDIDRRFREIVAGLRATEPGLGQPRQIEPVDEHPDEINPAPPAPEQLRHYPRPPEGPRRPAEGSGMPDARRSVSGESRPPGVPDASAGPEHEAEEMATDHRSYSPPEDPDGDHFVPPPPPPLPAGDLHFWAIVVGLVLGPVLVVLSAVVPVLRPPWGTVGVVLTVLGFILLVLRLPRQRDDDWGAKV